MGSPITWRNVDAPNPGAAAPILGQAQQSINGAFDTFAKLIQQKQAVDTANQAAGQDNLKQNFLDALAGVKTPEQLAALQASGQLDALQAGMGAQTRAAVRGADDARVASVRSNDIAANDYTNNLRDRAGAPVIDAVTAKAASGDVSGAQADVSAIADPHIRAAAQAKLNDAATQNFRMNSAQREDAYGAATQDFRLDAAKNANIRGNLETKAAQTAAADAEEQRRALADVTEAARVHQTGVSAAQTAIAPILATIPGLVRNADGNLAVDRLSDEQKATVNAKLEDAGFYPIDQLLRSDTNAAAELKAKLRQSGYKPTTIAALDPAISSALGTGSPAPIGRDADAAQRSLRAVQVEDQQTASQYGGIGTTDQKEELLKAGDEEFSKITLPLTGGRARLNAGLSNWLDTGGIPVGKPDPVTGVQQRVLPSPGQLRVLANKMGNLWFATGSDITSKLDEWAQSKEAQEGAKKVLAAKLRQQMLGIDPPTKK